MRCASRHRVSGRIGASALGGLAGILAALIGGVLIFGRQSMSEGAAKFMSALATQDLNTLTEYSVIDKDSPEVVRKKWERSLALGKHYIFVWNILSTHEDPDGKSGAVRIQVSRNANSGSSYEENFALPMVKADGRWKVEVPGISREMYPFLPRAGQK